MARTRSAKVQNVRADSSVVSGRNWTPTWWIVSRLEERNQSAAGSLAEGLEETVTLHRLGLFGVLGRSLKTTNGLESVNALVEERCAKVDHWQNSSQRQRWLATALLDIEPRLRKVAGYRHVTYE